MHNSLAAGDREKEGEEKQIDMTEQQAGRQLHITAYIMNASLNIFHSD